MRYAVLIAFLGMTTSAFAGNETYLQQVIFGHAIDKDAGYACYTRAYDAAHLKGHPHQNVTTAMMLLTGKPKTSDNPDPHYTAGVDFTFRKQKTHFQAFGDCPSVTGEGVDGKSLKLSCGIDCDGGTISVKMTDASSVLVSLPGGISGSDPNDAEGTPNQGHFGSDDKVFKLIRTEAKNCLPLAQEDEDKAALKK